MYNTNYSDDRFVVVDIFPGGRRTGVVILSLVMCVAAKANGMVLNPNIKSSV